MLDDPTPPLPLRLSERRGLVPYEDGPPEDGHATPAVSGPHVRIAHEVYDAYAHQCGPIAWAVFSALIRHADAEGYCFPSHATIAKGIGLKDRKAVIGAVSRLVALGMVRVEHRLSVAGARTSNGYTILVGMPARQTYMVVTVKRTGADHQTDRVCPSNALKPEPHNYNQSTKNDNTPQPPRGGTEKAPAYTAEFETFWSE